MTHTVKFITDGRLGSSQKAILRRAVSAHFPDDAIAFKRAEDEGPDVLGFGMESGVSTLGSKEMLVVPFPERHLAVALHRITGTWPTDLVPEKPEP